MNELKNRTVAELWQHCKERGVRCYSSLRKSDLIQEVIQDQHMHHNLNSKRVKDFTAYCSENKIKGYSKMRKADLITLAETATREQLPFVKYDEDDVFFHN